MVKIKREYVYHTKPRWVCLQKPGTYLRLLTVNGSLVLYFDIQSFYYQVATLLFCIV